MAGCALLICPLLKQPEGPLAIISKYIRRYCSCFNCCFKGPTSKSFKRQVTVNSILDLSNIEKQEQLMLNMKKLKTFTKKENQEGLKEIENFLSYKLAHHKDKQTGNYIGTIAVNSFLQKKDHIRNAFSVYRVTVNSDHMNKNIKLQRQLTTKNLQAGQQRKISEEEHEKNTMYILKKLSDNNNIDTPMVDIELSKTEIEERNDELKKDIKDEEIVAKNPFKTSINLNEIKPSDIPNKKYPMPTWHGSMVEIYKVPNDHKTHDMFLEMTVEPDTKYDKTILSKKQFNFHPNKNLVSIEEFGEKPDVSDDKLYDCDAEDTEAWERDSHQEFHERDKQGPNLKITLPEFVYSCESKLVAEIVEELPLRKMTALSEDSSENEDGTEASMGETYSKTGLDSIKVDGPLPRITSESQKNEIVDNSKQFRNLEKIDRKQVTLFIDSFSVKDQYTDLRFKEVLCSLYFWVLWMTMAVSIALPSFYMINIKSFGMKYFDNDSVINYASFVATFSGFSSKMLSGVLIDKFGAIVTFRVVTCIGGLTVLLFCFLGHFLAVFY